MMFQNQITICKIYQEHSENHFHILGPHRSFEEIFLDRILPRSVPIFAYDCGENGKWGRLLIQASKNLSESLKWQVSCSWETQGCCLTPDQRWQNSLRHQIDIVSGWPELSGQGISEYFQWIRRGPHGRDPAKCHLESCPAGSRRERRTLAAGNWRGLQMSHKWTTGIVIYEPNEMTYRKEVSRKIIFQRTQEKS